MARGFWDSVVETSTTTGTGDFTLAGPVTGYGSFSDYLSIGDIVYYLIEAIDGNGDRTGEWETGTGTYSATDTLTRTTFHDGSAFPTFTTFSAGTKRVSLVFSATAARFRGCLAYKATDQTAANYTTATAITFDTNDYDTDTIHDTGSNTSRLTVPADVTKIQLTGHAYITNFTASKYVSLYIYKNGTNTVYAGQGGSVVLNDTTSADIQVMSSVLDVTAGDYFELYLQVETDTSISVMGFRTWFAMEIKE